MPDEDRSEEFVRFIRENRDMIQRILDEDPDKPADPEPEPGPELFFDRIQSQVEPFRDYGRQVTVDILRVLADEEVQKHFLAGTMEMMSFFQAALRALPGSDGNTEIADGVDKVKDNAIRSAASVGIKSTAKSKLEKIDIKSVKKRLTDEFNLDSDR